MPFAQHKRFHLKGGCQVRKPIKFMFGRNFVHSFTQARGLCGAVGMWSVSAAPAPRATPAQSPGVRQLGEQTPPVLTHPDVHDTRGCSSARAPVDVHHLQQLQSHRCLGRARQPQRSPFATNVASAPSQQWEKSSWNFNITSPSRGCWGADSAATC